MISAPFRGREEHYHNTDKAVCYTPRKGVSIVPITLTIHIGVYTITITVKSRNRHSAK